MTPPRSESSASKICHTFITTSHVLTREIFPGSFMPQTGPCNTVIGFWAFRKADGYRVTATSPLFTFYALNLEEGLSESLKPA